MTKSAFFTQIFCFSLLLFATSCQNNTPSTKGDETANLRGDFIPEPDLSELVIDLTSSLEDVFKKGDMKAVADYFAVDAVILGPDGYKVEGNAGIQDYWAKIKHPLDWNLAVSAFSRNEAAILGNEIYRKWENKPPDWKSAVGEKLKDKNPIYQMGHSKIQYKNEKGEIKISDVDYVLIWCQQPDGAHKIAMHSFTLN